MREHLQSGVGTVSSPLGSCRAFHPRNCLASIWIYHSAEHRSRLASVGTHILVRFDSANVMVLKEAEAREIISAGGLV